MLSFIGLLLLVSIVSFLFGIFCVFIAQTYFNARAMRERRLNRFAKRMQHDPLLRAAFLHTVDYHLNK